MLYSKNSTSIDNALKINLKTRNYKLTKLGNRNIETNIIAASIRNPMHITQAALNGADIATVPYNVLMSLFKHPLTDKGIAAFLADWEGRK